MGKQGGPSSGAVASGEERTRSGRTQIQSQYRDSGKKQAGDNKSSFFKKHHITRNDDFLGFQRPVGVDLRALQKIIQ